MKVSTFVVFAMSNLFVLNVGAQGSGFVTSDKYQYGLMPDSNRRMREAAQDDLASKARSMCGTAGIQASNVLELKSSGDGGIHHRVKGMARVECNRESSPSDYIDMPSIPRTYVNEKQLREVFKTSRRCKIFVSGRSIVASDRPLLNVECYGGIVFMRFLPSFNQEAAEQAVADLGDAFLSAKLVTMEAQVKAGKKLTVFPDVICDDAKQEIKMNYARAGITYHSDQLTDFECLIEDKPIPPSAN